MCDFAVTNRECTGHLFSTPLNLSQPLPTAQKRLQMAVEWPLQHPEAFQRLALTPPRGVLLHGPPGGGKTLLALAAAHASKATLFSLRCASVFLLNRVKLSPLPGVCCCTPRPGTVSVKQVGCGGLMSRPARPGTAS
ncbi:unnamed protein product [Closterium sp. NIES-53]